MQDLESLQRLWSPLFPGLMGIELKEASPERVVGTMKVRADLCTTGEILHGGAIMALADTLGAVGTFQKSAPERWNDDDRLKHEVHSRGSRW